MAKTSKMAIFGPFLANLDRLAKSGSIIGLLLAILGQ
jgi:hypothetical protein